MQNAPHTQNYLCFAWITTAACKWAGLGGEVPSQILGGTSTLPQVPVKSNFTLQGQSCEQLRAQNSHFQNGFLTLRPPWMEFSPPFKKFKCSIFFQVKSQVCFCFIISLLPWLCQQQRFYSGFRSFVKLSGSVAFLKNQNESLAYSVFIIPSPAVF